MIRPDHEHCQSCFAFECRSTGFCDQIYCPEDCGFRLHVCKIQDHLTNICPVVQVDCANEQLGCPFVVPRYEMGWHLRKCPASVISCPLEWNRSTISKASKKLLKKESRTKDSTTCKALDPFHDVHDSKEIDIAWALRDQRIIANSFNRTRCDRQKRLNHFNKHHPQLPLINSHHDDKIWHPVPDFDSSDAEDEKRQREKREYAVKLKMSREDCYICQTDPSSQHLHVLGRLDSAYSRKLEEEKQKIDEQAEQRQRYQDAAFLLPFYQETLLRVNLELQQISPVLPKPHHVYTIVCATLMRRDEFESHCDLLHNHVLSLIDQFAINRCVHWPNGCRKYIQRLRPFDRTRTNAFLRYNQHLQSITVQHHDDCDSSKPISSQNFTFDYWSVLPDDVFFVLAQYLDSASLRCLSAVSHRCRALCTTLVKHRGFVHKSWQRHVNEDGLVTWREMQPRWCFSTCTSAVSSWHIDSRSLGSHTLNCEFNAENRVNHGDGKRTMVYPQHNGKVIAPHEALLMKLTIKPPDS